jgi:hypothetical protein
MKKIVLIYLIVTTFIYCGAAWLSIDKDKGTEALILCSLLTGFGFASIVVISKDVDL